MNAEKYFEKLIYADQKICADMEEIVRVRALLGYIPGANFDAEIHASGTGGSGVEKIVEKFIDLERKITQEIEELIDMKREAWRIISKIDNQQYKLVLQKFYMDRESLELIAAEMFLTYRRIAGIKAEALAEAQKIIDKHFI